MVLMHKELLVSLSDLLAISIECPTCHSEIRMKMDAEFKPSMMNVPAPLRNCPVCSTAFDSTLRPNIQSFREALSVLRDHSKISLQINNEEMTQG